MKKYGKIAGGISAGVSGGYIRFTTWNGTERPYTEEDLNIMLEEYGRLGAEPEEGSAQNRGLGMNIISKGIERCGGELTLRSNGSENTQSPRLSLEFTIPVVDG
jgi:hypothetical protein